MRASPTALRSIHIEMIFMLFRFGNAMLAEISSAATTKQKIERDHLGAYQRQHSRKLAGTFTPF